MTTDETELMHRQRAAFGRALNDAIRRSGLSLQEVSNRLGYRRAEPTISEWQNGLKEPRHHVVFALEEALDLLPGSLSVHLGYVPPTQIDVATAIASDPALPPALRATLLDVYQQFRRQAGGMAQTP